MRGQVEWGDVVGDLSPRSFLEDNWRKLRNRRDVFEQKLLVENRAGTKYEFLNNMAPYTGLVLIAGGAATRAKKEVAGDQRARRYGEEFGLDVHKSRALTPVPNLFSHDAFSFLPPIITTLDYTLWGVKDSLTTSQGNNLSVVYGNSADVEEMQGICERWGLTNVHFIPQHIHKGKLKPAGHADALLWMKDRLQEYPYTWTVFNSDVTDPLTYLELLALHTYPDLSAIMGTALLKNPTYPLEVDLKGRPTGKQGHNKLDGAEFKVTEGPSNIGNFVFRTNDLTSALSYYDDMFKRGGMYEEIGRAELAMDHIITDLACGNNVVEGGRLRQLCAYDPWTITSPAKAPSNILGYLYNQIQNLTAQGLTISTSGRKQYEKVNMIFRS